MVMLDIMWSCGCGVIECGLIQLFRCYNLSTVELRSTRAKCQEKAKETNVHIFTAGSCPDQESVQKCVLSLYTIYSTVRVLAWAGTSSMLSPKGSLLKPI